MVPKKIEYIYSKRKSISIHISDGGNVIVRAPRNVSKTKIDMFLKKSDKWITKKIVENQTQNKKLELHQYTKVELDKIKDNARKELQKRTLEISNQMGLNFKKFRLSGAKKRWGSCSNKKTISINWKLIFAPPEIIDYVITHELAHLKHMNHSKRFWKYVETYNPNYKKNRKWLGKNDYLLRVGESLLKD